MSYSLWPHGLQHGHASLSAQTHVHLVGDAIQLSHSLSSPAPPAFNLSQHQGLFKWIISLHQVAKVPRQVINISGMRIAHELLFLHMSLIKCFRIFISAMYCAFQMFHVIFSLVLLHQETPWHWAWIWEVRAPLRPSTCWYRLDSLASMPVDLMAC